MEQENKVQFPGYRELFKEIKNQLSERSGITLKRSLLIGWPALIIVGIISYINVYGKKIDYSSFILIFTVFVPLALIYTVLLNNIFATEKLIWINSSHFNKNISNDDSWKIARKLFWPSLMMRLQLFFRYYFLPLFIYLFLCFLLFYKAGNEILGGMSFLYFFGFFLIIGPVILWFYFTYINIKLRYIWFIFIDNYGKEPFFYHDLFKEMYELNEINKAEAFRKSLAVDIGADFLQNLIGMSYGLSLKAALGQFGKRGQVFGDVASAYSSDVVAQKASLSKLAANYVLYCYSKEQLYKKPLVENEKIYSI
jgi:hypothetical protein